MRAFVGYFTTRSIHEHVDRFREEAEDFVKGKWVEPQNFHMTFQFLGEIDRERAIGVLKNIQNVARRYPPFRVQYSSLGVFPDPRHPRILWIGVTKGESSLRKLAGEISRLNKKIGLGMDAKPFHPHITVCRIKSVDRKKLSALLRSYKNFPFGTETVDRIALVSSSLTSVGPIYTVVEEFFLGRG